MSDMNSTSKKRLGFAVIDPKLQLELASKGGKAAHEMGVAHQFTSDEAKDAGTKGGNTLFAKRGRDYMRELGRKGGIARRAKQALQHQTEGRCLVSAITGGDTTFNEEERGYGGPAGL